MSNITETAAWQDLLRHKEKMANIHMRELFAADKNRAQNFSCSAAELFLDYAKNRITTETMALLCALAETVNLSQYIEKMFTGVRINVTEDRAVEHTKLRNLTGNLDKIDFCVANIRSGKWKGFSGKAITDVVNIGIGGSDLGPAMVTEALKPYCSSSITCHFVSNVDGTHIGETLKYLNPETTLFIIASKTFTTQETLCNANTAREWLMQKITNKKDLKKHFLAVTAMPKRAMEFGVAKEYIFPFAESVGGRYSLWSTIGLPIAIAIGNDNFWKLLEGAHAMDEHFRHTPYEQNMPVLLALLGIWNSNFLGAKTLAVLPYDQYLHLLPAYLQQLDMESNGKRVTLEGREVNYTTAPVVWGAPGTNGQHAFHQLLMQGTQLVPVDFILPLKSHNPIGQHHLLLVANCLAQSQALMLGRNGTDLPPYKVIPGNVPSNTIVTDKITPTSLGALIALYEHKVFVQGVIWDINSFDQWGVELGKQLARDIIPALQDDNIDGSKFDCSTAALIERYRENYN